MNQPGEPVVRARNLRKDYGSGEGLVRAVDGIDLDVIRGETVAVMGPSGCGKSTLLHLLGGLDRPAAGELWLAGQRIDEMSERALAHLRRSDVGFVFQAFQLMDELTVLENVELPALAGSARPGRCRTALAGSPRPRQPGQPAHLLPQPPPVRPGCRAGLRQPAPAAARQWPRGADLVAEPERRCRHPGIPRAERPLAGQLAPQPARACHRRCEVPRAFRTVIH
jgi:ABC-type sugar transport system ATPase subunit